jgi:hypothetical protein
MTVPRTSSGTNVKPVVVIIDTVWKTPYRKDSEKPRFSRKNKISTDIRTEKITINLKNLNSSFSL